MRIVVLSDTHVSAQNVDEVLEVVGPHLADADHILHAGDVVSAELLDALECYAPLTAVAGNMDGPAISARWCEQERVELAGKRIGLLHGWGSSMDLPRKVFERFTDSAGRPTVDAIVFGHSHRPLVEYRQGVLMFNPGSATDRRSSPFCSLGVLDVGRGIDARIVRL